MLKLRKDNKQGSVNVEAMLNDIVLKLHELIDNTDVNNTKDIKRTENYLSALSSHIDAINRERGFILTEQQKSKLKRGQVVWVDFGFNIGKEFGGKHPAIILRVTSNYQSITVIPIDGDTDDEDIINNRKKKDYWFEIPNVYGMKKMSRWANAFRVTEISSIRVDFKNTNNTYIGYDILDQLDELIAKYQYKPKIKSKFCAKC